MPWVLPLIIHCLHQTGRRGPAPAFSAIIHESARQGKHMRLAARARPCYNGSAEPKGRKPHALSSTIAFPGTKAPGRGPVDPRAGHVWRLSPLRCVLRPHGGLRPGRRAAPSAPAASERRRAVRRGGAGQRRRLHPAAGAPLELRPAQKGRASRDPRHAAVLCAERARAPRGGEGRGVLPPGHPHRAGGAKRRPARVDPRHGADRRGLGLF